MHDARVCVHPQCLVLLQLRLSRAPWALGTAPRCVHLHARTLHTCMPSPPHFAVLADEWGYDTVGTSLPAGIDPHVLLKAVPDEAMQHSTRKALAGLVAPLALMAAGYAWMWFMHSIIPLWQQLICWMMVGTGYAGIFNLAHECARNTFLPFAPVTQVRLQQQDVCVRVCVCCVHVCSCCVCVTVCVCVAWC